LRIGACHVGLDHVPPSLEPLRSALNELGYADGKNLRLDFRNLADEAEALAVNRAFARERVDLIVAFENDCIRAAKAATAEIPVVFLHGNDPVTSGFVANLAHPGGNLIGVTTFLVESSQTDRAVHGDCARPEAAAGAVRPAWSARHAIVAGSAPGRHCLKSCS